MDLVTLADAPQVAPDAELPRAKIVVAKLGTFNDRRYGQFGITRSHVTDWKRNLAVLPGGQAPIDFDHGPEKGQGTKAAGWITTLEVKTGRQLKAEDPRRFARLADDREYAAADVEFSRAGADAIRAKEYRLISPTFTDHLRDESGKDHGRGLLGAALTNRPFLKRDMPVISLADDLDAPIAWMAERTDADLAVEVSDSRRRMPELTNIAKALRLDEDATEATILSHIGNVVILDADTHADLERRAQAGDEAIKTLSDTRFDAAWTKALDAGAVAPAEKDDLVALYEGNEDTVIKLLETRAASGAKVAPTKPAGDGRAPTGDVTDSTDPEDRAAIAARAKALAASEKITILEAIERIEDELAAKALED